MWWFSAAFGCSCGLAPPLAVQAEGEPFVFQGRVVEANHASPRGPGFGGTAEIEVRHVWRGEVPARVTVTTDGSAGCGPDLGVGDELAFAVADLQGIELSCGSGYDRVSFDALPLGFSPPAHTRPLAPTDPERWGTAARTCDLRVLRGVDRARLAEVPAPLDCPADVLALWVDPDAPVLPGLATIPVDVVVDLVARFPGAWEDTFQRAEGRPDVQDALFLADPARGIAAGHVPPCAPEALIALARPDGAALRAEAAMRCVDEPDRPASAREPVLRGLIAQGALADGRWTQHRPGWLVSRALRTGMSDAMVLELVAAVPAEQQALARQNALAAAVGRPALFEAWLAEGPPAEPLEVTRSACARGVEAVERVHRLTGAREDPWTCACAAGGDPGVLARLPEISSACADILYERAFTFSDLEMLATLEARAPRPLPAEALDQALRAGAPELVGWLLARGVRPAGPVPFPDGGRTEAQTLAVVDALLAAGVPIDVRTLRANAHHPQAAGRALEAHLRDAPTPR